jgi:1-acyl-sn-glycerol-3-phosphate acyltransferase
MKERRNPLLFTIFRAFVIRPVLKLLFRFRVEGKENIPRQGPVIFVCKHQSWMDLFAISEIMTRQMNYVAKKELFENLFGDFKGSLLEKAGNVMLPFTSGGLWGLGAIPIDRENPQKILSSFKHIKTILSGDEFLVLFPEGRTVPGRMGEFKSGLINLLLKMDSRSRISFTFIPVGISYGRGKFRKDLLVKIGSPISPDCRDDNPTIVFQRTVEALTYFDL